MSWNGTVTCSHCYRRGHNKRKCPQLTEDWKQKYIRQAEMVKHYETATDEELVKVCEDREWNINYHTNHMERARQEYMKRTKIDLVTGEKVTNKAAKAERMKKVTCGYCGQRGHTRRVCQNVKNDYAVYAERTRQARQEWYERLKASGMGIGSMVVGQTTGYDADGQWGRFNVTALVTAIQWEHIDAHRPDTRAIRVKSNSDLKGDTQGPRLSDLSMQAVEQAGDASSREVKAVMPSGAVPPMPENWLTDILGIKEVFDTKDERPWDYKWGGSDDWRAQVREQLGLPKCAYDE